MPKRVFALLLIVVLFLGGCRWFGSQPKRPESTMVDLTEQWGRVDAAIRSALDKVGEAYQVEAERLSVDIYPTPEGQLHSPSRRMTANFSNPVSTDKVVGLLAKELEGVPGRLADIQTQRSAGWQTVHMEVGYTWDRAQPPIFVRTHTLDVRYKEPSKPALPPAVPGQTVGKVAIIIDDFGYGGAGTQEILALKGPITVAVLPHLPYSVTLAGQAKRQGHEVILHQPMESQNPEQDPGPGAILVTTPDDEIRSTIESNLKQVPGAVGVNNHMGSLATADQRVMTAVLGEAKQRGLYFIDSATTPVSVVSKVATGVGLPVGVNERFLDNVRDKETIKEEIRQLARLSADEGPSLGIGHVHEAMASALQEMMPELQQAGIKLIPASQIVRRP